ILLAPLTLPLRSSTEVRIFGNVIEASSAVATACQQVLHMVVSSPQAMAREFKPVRFFVMMGVAAFVVCGVTVFCTHRAAHGRTAEERAAYAIGEKAGEEAPQDAKLPSDAELNMMAQKYFKWQGSGEQQGWDLAFEKGYANGFKKTHSRQ